MSLKYFCEIPFRLIRESTISIVDNFVILSPQQIGLKLPERLVHGEKKLYTFKQWLSMYDKICVKKSNFILLRISLKAKLISANYVIRNIIKDIKEIFKSKK